MGTMGRWMVAKPWVHRAPGRGSRGRSTRCWEGQRSKASCPWKWSPGRGSGGMAQTSWPRKGSIMDNKREEECFKKQEREKGEKELGRDLEREVQSIDVQPPAPETSMRIHTISVKKIKIKNKGISHPVAKKY